MKQRLGELAVALADRGGASRRVSRRALRIAGNALRRLLLSSGDPVITYRLDGATLKLPLSHGLPSYRREFPDYSANVGRLAAALVDKYGEGMPIVDVGANVGDTAAIVRAHARRAPILCIEGHLEYLQLLRENAAQLVDVTVESALLGAAEMDVSAELWSEQGTAGLRASARSTRLTTLPAVLERQARFRTAKLLKIDTDGWDLEVLAGALDWIAIARPVLFFEWDPALAVPTAGRLAIDLKRDLGSRGYKRVMIFANEGGYVLSADLAADDRLDDVLAYYSGHQNRRYCDIAAFTPEDLDVWSQLRELERARMLA